MTTCESTTQRINRTVTVNCERESGHFGAHQVVITNDTPGSDRPYLDIVWEQGGMGENPMPEFLWNECDFCSILIDSTQSECTSCRYWQGEATRSDLPNRLIMDGIVFNVAPNNSSTFTDTSEKTYTVIWYDKQRTDLVTNRITRFGEIPEHMRHLFGDDNGYFKPEEYPDGSMLVPYGRHIPKEKIEEFFDDRHAQEHNLDICGQASREYGRPDFVCHRPADHLGLHQQFIQGYRASKPLLFMEARWEIANSNNLIPWETLPYANCLVCDIIIDENESGQCRKCKFWSEQVKDYDPNSIIFNHELYELGAKGGFGGRTFKIEFLNSSRAPLITDGLWSQGNIPEHFWNLMPDTARISEV